MEFKIGDVVQLKSGGRPMTVADFITDEDKPEFLRRPAVRCWWLSTDGIGQQGFFSPAMMNPCKPLPTSVWYYQMGNKASLDEVKKAAVEHGGNFILCPSVAKVDFLEK